MHRRIGRGWSKLMKQRAGKADRASRPQANHQIWVFRDAWFNHAGWPGPFQSKSGRVCRLRTANPTTKWNEFDPVLHTLCRVWMCGRRLEADRNSEAGAIPTKRTSPRATGTRWFVRPQTGWRSTSVIIRAAEYVQPSSRESCRLLGALEAKVAPLTSDECRWVFDHLKLCAAADRRPSCNGSFDEISQS